MRNKSSRMRNKDEITPASPVEARLSSMYDNAHKRLFSRKKRACPLSGENAPLVDYKNISLLKKYISERGRILPSRITSISAKKQRGLKAAIKKARVLALLPFVEQ
jgi:small subunit ribosomal protein S18